MIRYLKYFLVFLCLSGCVSKNQTDAAKTSTKTQGTILEPAPLIQGNNNTLHLKELPLSERDIKANNAMDLHSEYAIAMQISVGLNIFLFGIGAFLIYVLAKKSKVIRATSAIVDNVGASFIAMAQNSDDHKAMNAANHARAEIETIRRHL